MTVIIENFFGRIGDYLRSDLIRRLTQRRIFSRSLSSASILKRIASWDAGPCRALENPMIVILWETKYSFSFLDVSH